MNIYTVNFSSSDEVQLPAAEGQSDRGKVSLKGGQQRPGGKTLQPIMFLFSECHIVFSRIIMTSFSKCLVAPRSQLTDSNSAFRFV